MRDVWRGEAGRRRSGAVREVPEEAGRIQARGEGSHALVPWSTGGTGCSVVHRADADAAMEGKGEHAPLAVSAMRRRAGGLVSLRGVPMLRCRPLGEECRKSRPEKLDTCHRCPADGRADRLTVAASCCELLGVARSCSGLLLLTRRNGAGLKRRKAAGRIHRSGYAVSAERVRRIGGTGTKYPENRFAG